MADTPIDARIKKIMDAISGEEGSGDPYIMKRDNPTPEDEADCEADENCQDIETPDDAEGQQVALQKREEYNDLMKNGQPLPTEEELQNNLEIPDSVKPYLSQHINGLNSGEVDPYGDDVQDETPQVDQEVEPSVPEEPRHATMMVSEGRLYGNKLPPYMRNKSGNFVKPL